MNLFRVFYIPVLMSFAWYRRSFVPTFLRYFLKNSSQTEVPLKNAQADAYARDEKEGSKQV